MVQVSDNKSGIVVRLRFAPDEIRALKAKAKDHGRSVPAEIALRVLGKMPSGSPFSGWPAADAADFQAVGDAIAQLFAEVTLMTGTNTELKQRLGYLKPSVLALLDELGAEDAKPDDAQFFAGITRGLIGDGGALDAITKNIRQKARNEDGEDAPNGDAKISLVRKAAGRKKKPK